MNFLLHHHFAAHEMRDQDHSDFIAIGAMLPDLFRMATGGRARRHEERQKHPIHDERAALLLGCDHHVSIDRWFHAADPFVRGERDLRRAFLLPDSPKLVLFAHAAWEMCLDGAWLRRSTEEERQRLRRSSQAAPFATDVADHQGVLSGFDDAERRRFDARMARIFAAFDDETIYSDYREARGVARRVAGIRSAFGLGLPLPETMERWSLALEPFVDRSDAALEELIAHRASSRAAVI